MRKFVESARLFAINAHKPQDPHLKRCEAVAELVDQSGGDKYEIAAAWLHDIVQCNVSIVDIGEKFGDIVATIVDGLTDLADLPDSVGSTKLQEKSTQAGKLRKKSIFVKRVALAIEIVTLRDIAAAGSSWDDRKRFDYALGARLKARECRGISDYLDIEFGNAYDRAVATHS